MTKEQINIAIAKACGWTFINQVDKRPHGLPPDGKKDRYTSPLPDYCNDLNAMHEAEKILSDESHADYACELVKTIRQNGEWFESVSATAAQRAETFLRTINKWEGGSDDH
jgi:hypothetical protein